MEFLVLSCTANVLEKSTERNQSYIKKGHSNKHRLYAARTINTIHDENDKYYLKVLHT